MRPARAPLHASRPARSDLKNGSALRVVATTSFAPRGPNYDPVRRLRRRHVALRGGPDAIVIVFSWVKGVVRVKVVAAGACSSEDVEHAIAAARGLSAVDDDPTDFLTMVHHHPILGPLARTADPRLSSTPTLFESFAVAVIEQLVTGFEARASIRRLWRIAGEAVPTTKLVAAPSAKAVKRVPMWKMHAIGVGSQRAATLREGAGRGESLERLRLFPGDVVIEKLQSLPGVGPWTANHVARHALAFPDAVPVGDFHAPFTISAALGGPPDLTLDDRDAADQAMLNVLEPFRPHRGRVALMLEAHSPSRNDSSSKPPSRLARVDPHRRQPWRY